MYTVGAKLPWRRIRELFRTGLQHLRVSTCNAHAANMTYPLISLRVYSSRLSPYLRLNMAMSLGRAKAQPLGFLSL